MSNEIYLRPLEEKDAETSHMWRNDPDIWKFTGSKPDRHITPEIEKEWIKQILKRPSEKRFAICLKESGQYIGNVQLTGITDYDGELHIFIGEQLYWGKGIGTKATDLLVEYAFNELKLQCVYLFVKKENTSAVRAYEKVGFNTILEVENQNLWMAKYSIDQGAPKTVSVFMITYNHEKFIAKALDGILEQKTDFDLEIVIGDDNSTDNNKKIILEYARKYPNRFKLILHPANVGAARNQRSVFRMCKGKYIALCEGDDYWTDPLKLQKQVDLLEANPNFAGCGTQSLVMYEDINKDSHIFKDGVNNILTIKDFIRNRPFHTASFMFSGNIPAETIPLNIFSADRAIYLLVASFGDIYYLDEITCVYRRNGLSITSELSEKEMKTDFNMVPWLKKINSGFPGNELKSFLHLCIYTNGADPKKLEIGKLIKHYFLFVVFSFSYFPKNLGDIKWGSIWFFQNFRARFLDRVSK